MKKFLSMLLAVSMSLSVMCSSFTISAVDGGSTDVQTESSAPADLSALFGSELNEKIADQSNEYVINSVEMNGNTASVSYRAAGDCTVIVGIYEDDDTDGTHMLTFGQVGLKAGETEAKVVINDLPQYFYLKVYIVDTATLRPLAKEYKNPNYTKSMQDFFELTVDDFDPDRVWNFDENPNTNFMALSKAAVLINTDHDISKSDIEYSSNQLTVHKADTDGNLIKLKPGDPFMLFHDDGIIYGVAASISLSNGNETAVINYKSAVISDLFDYIRLESEDDDEPEAASYNADPFDVINNVNSSGAQSRSSILPEKINASFTLAFKYNENEKKLVLDKSKTKGSAMASANFTDLPGELSVSGSVTDPKDNNQGQGSSSGSTGSGSGSSEDDKNKIDKSFSAEITASVTGTYKIYYNNSITKEKVYTEITMTPAVTAKASGSAAFTAAKPKTMPSVHVPIPGTNVFGVNVFYFKLGLDFSGIKITASGDATVTLSNKYKLKYDYESDSKEWNIDSPNWDLNIGGSLEVSTSIGFKAALGIVDSGFDDKNGEDLCLLEVSIKPTLTPKWVLARADLGNMTADLTKKEPERHDCEPFTCFNCDFSLLFDLNATVSVPLLTLTNISSKANWEIMNKELLPEDLRHFNFSRYNNWVPQFGECSNKSYRTYIYVVDENGDPVEGIFVFNTDVTGGSEYNEGYTDKDGKVIFYLKPSKDIHFKLTGKEYDDAELTAKISDADEKLTVTMLSFAVPDKITPLPRETEKVPQYLYGESLRYTDLLVEYDDGRSFNIPFSEEYIKAYDPYTIGMQTLVIEYNRKEWTQEIEIVGDMRHIESISINTPPDKIRYELNEELDITGLTIDAVFTDGTVSEGLSVTEKMISGFDSSTGGYQNVTVTYTDMYGDTAEAYFEVKIVDGPIDGIEMYSAPEKTEYEIDDHDFFVKGAKIKVLYNDGTEPKIVTVTSDMVTGFDTSSPGTKTLTVTYQDEYGKTHITYFDIEVIEKTISSIEIVQLLDRNKYCELNGELNYEGALLQVNYSDGDSRIKQITEAMTGEFDSSRLGTFMVTVTYGPYQKHYYVDVVGNLKKVCRIGFIDDPPFILYTDNYKDKPYGQTYDLWEYFMDGTSEHIKIDGGKANRDANNDIIYEDKYGGIIKIDDFDRTKADVHTITATYYSPENPDIVDTSVKAVSIYRAVVEGDGRTPGELGNFSTGGYYVTPNYYVGQSMNFSDYYFRYSEWKLRDNGRYGWESVNPYQHDSDGNVILDEHRNPIPEPGFLLSSIPCLGGYDSSYPHSGYVYFKYRGYVIGKSYTISGRSATSSYSAAPDYDNYIDLDYQYSEPENTYEDTNDTETDETFDAPDVPDTDESADAPEVTETPDTDEATDTPTVTETPDTVDVPEAEDDSDENVSESENTDDDTEIETGTAEEAEVFGNDSGIPVLSLYNLETISADYTDLHKSDIYNIYVVKNSTADILGKDNLLFVGQSESDSNGNLSISYTIAAGEDVTVILIPMRPDDESAAPDDDNKDDDNDPIAPDTPSDPDSGNTGDSENPGSSYPTVGNNWMANGNAVPAGASVTQRFNVNVENKITGKTTTARAEKTGNSVTVDLGTENNGRCANIYTRDGEYICSAVIEKGKAIFSFDNDGRFKVVIDEFSHGDDVSADAGISSDNDVTEKEFPYAVMISLIITSGICLNILRKKYSEQKDIY